MKISANELRLCNYVNDNWQRSNEPLQLNEMEFKVRVLELNCKDLSPIPLTEQWLEDSVLIPIFKHKKYKGWTVSDSIKIIKEKNTFNLYIYPNSGKSIGAYIMEIKYVHQFQNLCLDLTEKELTK